jgi:membrane dipeptidase
MVCFVPGFLTEHSREYSEAADAEKDRLEKLYPNDTAKMDAGMREWRRTHRERRLATLNDVANHIDHVRKVAGIDCVGIGSDFDGFGGTTEGLEDVSKYPDLLAELLRRGYSKEDVKKIAGQNLLRVMRKVEKVARQLSSNAP